MKKYLLLFNALALVFLLLIALNSCQKCEHKNRYETFENPINPTCTEPGTYDEALICSDCNELITRTKKIALLPLGHDISYRSEKEATCTEDGYSGHYYCKVCNETDEYEIYEATGHDFNETTGTCKNCNEKEVFGFTLSSDGTYYILSSVGELTVNDITIPKTYKGLPVSEIGYRAFKHKNFTSITIGDNIKKIQNEAFLYCSLKTVKIGSGLTDIQPFTFYECDKLEKVFISDSVISIGEYAFSGCPNLTDIYYTGSADKWSQITIDNTNHRFNTATMHYNYVEEN